MEEKKIEQLSRNELEELIDKTWKGIPSDKSHGRKECLKIMKDKLGEPWENVMYAGVKGTTNVVSASEGLILNYFWAIDSMAKELYGSERTKTYDDFRARFFQSIGDNFKDTAVYADLENVCKKLDYNGVKGVAQAYEERRQESHKPETVKDVIYVHTNWVLDQNTILNPIFDGMIAKGYKNDRDISDKVYEQREERKYNT
ncbi:MAG: hypothetical protein KKF46_02410 [Nanoarchaeota archaeon]|nr:hypothetical protein [Nanoarchaeota archaeon]MBU1321185.1 hypothetical protein [Nanoarchaeota archaeon]MBU1598313.1 hypothetical protein [Nanoarchaeota archaeon]MBU2441111.1 hypothetical protein [Nanoarchaeota archaeon]